MKQHAFTVFTPTFNRADLLVRLKDSLKEQTYKNLEWIIVDDGSTDHTKEIVKSFSEDIDFQVRYYFQENQGKHIALNTGIDLANNGWFITVDSDDFLDSLCLERCNDLLNEYDAGGITFLHADPSRESKKNKPRVWKEKYYRWNGPGEMVFCIKTEIFRTYKFPVFAGEKFCRETLVYDRILQKEKIYFTDNVLAYGEYLEDGLTSKSWELMKGSPQYTLLFFKEKMQNPFIPADRKGPYIKGYYDMVFSRKKGITIFRILDLKITFLCRYVFLKFDTFKRVP